MGSSRKYWQYARECARWAKESQNKEDHDLMVDMAKAWTHVALTDLDVAKAAREAFAKEPKLPLHS
jgi:hypothetical protein